MRTSISKISKQKRLLTTLLFLGATDQGDRPEARQKMCVPPTSCAAMLTLNSVGAPDCCRCRMAQVHISVCE